MADGAGPWLKYGKPTAPAIAPQTAGPVGPWQKYAKPTTPAPAVAADTGGSFLPEVGKGLAAGAVDATGTAIVGAGGQNAAFLQSRIDNAKARLAMMDAIDRGETIPGAQAPMPGADWNASPGAGGIGLGTQTGDDDLDTANVYRTLTPEQRKEFRASQQRVLDTAVNPGEASAGLIKAGGAVKDWGAETFKAAKDYEDSFTRSFTQGLGSIAPFIVAGAAGAPAVGMAVGSSMSSGEAMERAIQAGVSREQLLAVIKSGALPGMTEQIPVEALFAKVPLPAMGRFTGALTKVLGQAAIEGGQEGVQQTMQNLIAKYTYNPDQDVMEGVLEAAAMGAAVGGGLKTVMPSTYRKGKTAVPAPLPTEAQQPAEAPWQKYGKTTEQETAVEREGEARAPAGPEAGDLPPPVAASPGANVEPDAWDQEFIGTMPDEEAARGAGQALSTEDPASGISERQGEGTQNDLAPPPETQNQPSTIQKVPGELPIAPDIDVLRSRRGLETDASRSRPAEIEKAQDLDVAGQRVQEPKSIEQANTGNYKKAHVRVAGFDVAIETPKGAIRRQKDPTQPYWEAPVSGHYGYIKRTEGADSTPQRKEGVDIILGDNPKSKKLYIVDQKAPGERGRFDEHKVIGAVDSLAEARDLYVRMFNDGSGNQRIGAISAIKPKTLRDWLATPSATRSAYAYNKQRLTESGYPADMKGKIKRPPSLVEFLAANGGVRDFKGELGTMDADKVFIPGTGKLVRPNGRTLDQARALAVENGYLQDTDWEGGVSQSTVDDLLVAMRDDIGSRSRFSQVDDDWAGAWREEQSREIDGERETNERDRVMAEAADLELDTEDAYVRQAIDEAIEDRIPLADALERVAMRFDANEEVETQALPVTPFFDEEPYALQPGTAPQGSEGERDQSEGGNEPVAAGSVEAVGIATPAGGESGPARAGEAADEGSAGPRAEVSEPDASAIWDEEIAKARAEEAAKEKRGTVGMMVASGEVYLTSTGRKTTPVPKIGTDTNRKTVATVKRMDTWLMENAVAEAESRGDEFNARQFRANVNKPSQADKDSAEYYLFDDEFVQPVPKPLLKPMSAPAPAKGQSSMFGEATDAEKAQAAADKPLKAMKDLGFDGMRLIEPGTGSDVDGSAWMVFDNTQVKSADVNSGAYNPTNPDIHASAKSPAGWESADTDLPVLTGDDMRAIEDIVLTVSGLDRVHFRDAINAARGGDAARQWGVDPEAPAELAGFYSSTFTDQNEFVRDIIAVSMRAPYGGRQTAYHEAFHRVQALFLNAQERAILAASVADLAALVRMKRGNVTGMSQKEIEAEAFAIYADMLDTNGESMNARLHIGIRRAWAKLDQMFRRIKNYLKGRGFQTWEDVYDAARAGKLKDRPIGSAPASGHTYYQPAWHGTPHKWAGRKADIGKIGTGDDTRIEVTDEFQLMPERAERVPNVPARQIPTAILTKRLDGALKASVAHFKQRSSKERQTAEDGESARDYLTRKWVDYLHPLKKLQDSVGVRLTSLNDAYMNARLAEKAAGAQIMTMHDKYVAPAMKALAAGGANLQDLHKYLYALHAEERNRVVGLRNPEDSQLYKAIEDHSLVGASGMSVNQVRQIIAESRKDPEKHKALRTAAGFIRQMLDNELKNQRRNGLISDETYELLTQQWKNYVPLKGMEGMSEEGFWTNGTKGFDVRGDEFKTALGRFTEAENIIAHAVTQNEQSILRQHKNEVGKAMARFINEFDPEGETIAQVYWGGKDDFLGDIEKAPEVYKRIMGKDGKVEYRRVPNPFNRMDDVVAAKIGGRTFWIKFKDPKVGLAMRKMTKPELGAALQMLRKVTVWQSVVNTRMNPAFTPINLIRDAITGAIHLLDEGFSVREIANIMSSVPSAIAALWRISRGKGSNDEMDTYAKEFLAAGGKITFNGYKTVEENLKTLEKQMRSDAGMRNPALVKWDQMLKVLGDVNDAAENGIRLASYAAARKQGRTPKAAAFMSSDLTVDFTKHGEFGPTMNSLFVFFNASLQGNINIAARLANSKAVRVAVGAVVAGGLMQHLFNMVMAGDDDDGENAYLKMLKNEPYKLERQWVLFIPGTTRYVSFPMPYGYNAFHHFGLQGGAIMTGDTSPTAGALDSFRVYADAFNPIGGGSLLSMAMPTIGDPVVDLYTNTNFAGAPISPVENPFDRAPDPQSGKSFGNTHPFWKWAAETSNKAFGGDEIVPAKFGDVYPDTLEHLWGYATGGLGRFVGDISNTATSAVKGEIEPTKVPWVKSFYGEVGDQSRRSEYFKQREEVQAVEGYLKGYNETGQTQKAAEYRAENERALRASSAFKGTEKQRKGINKERRRIEDSDMSSSDRDAALERLDKQELAAMQQARRAYFEAGK